LRRRARNFISIKLVAARLERRTLQERGDEEAI